MAQGSNQQRVQLVDPNGQVLQTLQGWAGKAQAVTDRKAIGLIEDIQAKLQELLDDGTVVEEDVMPTYLHMAEGRLSLTQSTPVTTSDVTAATRVWYEPYLGNRVSLYSGGSWEPVAVAPGTVSVAVPATTVTPFDIFGYASGNSLALTTVNWTSDTARATSLTTQDGVYVASGNAALRYLGTGRTTGSSGQTEDSFGGAHQSGGKRFLWNMYNRVLRRIGVKDTTDSWAYSTASYRQTNAATGNKVEFVTGVDDMLVIAHATTMCSCSGAGQNPVAGVGVDSTSAASHFMVVNCSAATTSAVGSCAFYRANPAVGYHYLAWLEYGPSAGTGTFYGDAGSVSLQYGLLAELFG